MNEPIHLTAGGEEKLLASTTLPILIDFYADWCGPCRMLAPVIAELAAESEGKYVICKVNVDAEPALAQKYGVMSIPKLVVVKDGAVVSQAVGARPKSAVLAMLAEAQ